MKVAIALGGGAARGYAHLGVLKVLQREKIKVDIVTGTSIGSLIGAMYALEGNAYSVIEKLISFVRSDHFRETEMDFFNELRKSSNRGFLKRLGHLVRKGYVLTYSLTRESLVSRERYFKSIEMLLDDTRIETLPIKFATVAVDLISGDKIVLSSGSVRFAVAASSAIPGFLPPVPDGERLLADGGWVENVPVELARNMGADVVIAVDLNSKIEKVPPLERGLDVLLRSDDIARYYLKNFYLEKADIVLQPDVSDIFWADFRHVEKGIIKGEEEAERKLSRIKALLG